MTKIFSNKKRSKKRKVMRRSKAAESLEWLDFDDEEEYDEIDEEEYYEDEEYEDEEEYYEDEEYEDEEEYYEDEEYEDEEEYYEDEEYEDEEEYYEDEEYEDEEEYYEDEEYEDEEEYYEDEEYEDEEEYYEDEDYEEEERGFRKVIAFFGNMSVVDHVLAFTGVIVLVMASVVGTLYLGAKSDEKQIAAFAEVAEGLEGMPVIGESGLLAVADAQAAKLTAAELQEIEEEANQIDEETGKIEVGMNLTSIQKDLKIKFVNKKSGKLIPNVAFEVEVKGPSGDSYTFKDEDKDGIIYQKDIASGKYTVAMTGPADPGDYSFSKEAVAITVRDTIEYKKVDIADEIKTESQINAKAEDTAVNDTVVESENKDTVEWVESTKTLIEGTETSSDSYEKVDRKNITDPSTKTAAGFRLLSEVTETPEPTETPGETQEPDPTTEVPDPTPEPTQEPDPTQTPAPTQTPEETPAATPTTVPTESPVVTAAPTPTVSPSVSPSATPTATVTPTPTATPTVSPTPTPSATPTPTNSAKTDTKTDLKSNSGDKLYVKDSNGNFREAKYADYYNDSIKEFYRKVTKTTGEYRYTGWQTIDGSTYFFDKNGNKVTGEQVIQGAKYTFNENGVLNTGSGQMGIDVSKWNGKIDWQAVKNSGVSYAIIRCGYRGSSTGALVEDPMFRTNIQGAQNAGIKVGVYFFTQATNEVEAVEEASMVLSLIRGYNLSYPVFLDVEATSGNNGRADHISVDTRTAVCKAFCQTIQNSGYKAGIYANKTWLTSYINAPSLTGYRIWLAQYAATPSYTRTKYDMWQYSSKGRVTGIGTDVDMNISYLGY